VQSPFLAREGLGHPLNGRAGRNPAAAPERHYPDWGGRMMFDLRPTWHISEMIWEDNVTFADFLKNEKPKSNLSS
jgi:hypothetical protein